MPNHFPKVPPITKLAHMLRSRHTLFGIETRYCPILLYLRRNCPGRLPEALGGNFKNACLLIMSVKVRRHCRISLLLCGTWGLKSRPPPPGNCSMTVILSRPYRQIAQYSNGIKATVSMSYVVYDLKITDTTNSLGILYKPERAVPDPTLHPQPTFTDRVKVISNSEICWFPSARQQCSPSSAFGCSQVKTKGTGKGVSTLAQDRPLATGLETRLSTKWPGGRVTPVLIGQLLSFLTSLQEVTISLSYTGRVSAFPGTGLQSRGGLTEDSLGD